MQRGSFSPAFAVVPTPLAGGARAIKRSFDLGRAVAGTLCPGLLIRKAEIEEEGKKEANNGLVKIVRIN